MAGEGLPLARGSCQEDRCWQVSRSLVFFNVWKPTGSEVGGASSAERGFQTGSLGSWGRLDRPSVRPPDVSELVAQVPWEADGALSGWPIGLSPQTHPPLELRYTLSVQSLVYMRRSVPAWTHTQWLGRTAAFSVPLFHPLSSPLPFSLPLCGRAP